MRIFDKSFSQSTLLDCFGKRVLMRRPCSLFWIFSSTLLIFLGLGCAAFVNIAVVLFCLFFSSLTLLASVCFRGWGFGFSSCIFLAIYSHYCLFMSPSRLWGIGLAVSFVLSWYIFTFSLSLIEDEQAERQGKYDQLSQAYDEMQASYEKTVQDKAIACQFLEKRMQSLEAELQECRLTLQDSCKKQEHMALDLQILSDQKSSWLEEYTVLHNEYIRMVAGDETTSVFSWVAGDERSFPMNESDEDTQLWISALREKDERLAALEKELVQERSLRQDLENQCGDLREYVQKNQEQHLRLKEIQDSLQKKDQELGQLREILQKGEHLDSISYKGRYLQLKEQFADKSRVLDDTRKELFLAKEENLAKQKFEEVSSNFADMKDIKLIQGLLEQIENLEEEISLLEELISHNLSL